jgi:hypothetical protein
VAERIWSDEIARKLSVINSGDLSPVQKKTIEDSLKNVLLEGAEQIMECLKFVEAHEQIRFVMEQLRNGK